MKESYVEGLATHGDPDRAGATESCRGGEGDGVRGARTGRSAGAVNCFSYKELARGRGKGQVVGRTGYVTSWPLRCMSSWRFIRIRVISEPPFVACSLEDVKRARTPGLRPSSNRWQQHPSPPWVRPPAHAERRSGVNGIGAGKRRAADRRSGNCPRHARSRPGPTAA